jgi:hypothetical protein
MGWGWLENIFRRNSPPPPPPPPDPRVVREQKRVQITMTRNDLAQQQAEYDKLVPDEAQKAKIRAANDAATAYIGPKQTQFDYEFRLFNQALTQVDTLVNSGSIALAQKYRSELAKKHEKIAADYQKNKETAFTNRRRFLDANPQEGTPGIGWFQSIDDQVLLTFWVCYILFIGSGMTYVLSYFSEKIQSSRSAMIVWVMSIVIAVVIAHVFIKLYA